MTDAITIIFEPAEEGGFTACIPEVPGAVSEGETIDEARAMVLDADGRGLGISPGRGAPDEGLWSDGRDFAAFRVISALGNSTTQKVRSESEVFADTERGVPLDRRVSRNGRGFDQGLNAGRLS